MPASYIFSLFFHFSVSWTTEFIVNMCVEVAAIKLLVLEKTVSVSTEASGRRQQKDTYVGEGLGRQLLVQTHTPPTWRARFRHKTIVHTLI